MTLSFLLVATLAQGTAGAPASQPSAPPAREIAPDTFLVEGAILPDRGPDGNTVILVAPNGLVVIDTGRHTWHSDAILAFAQAQRRPIIAVVNTHWHLDHSSGNGRVKAAHPGAQVYTTTAVHQALAPGGFLARNLAEAQARPPDPSLSEARREESAIFVATMAAADALRPDVPVSHSGPLALAGRPLAVRVSNGAVTAADLWIYDETSRVAVLGDLVTLPAPFFETACPRQWQDTLDQVWATPFRLAVPGHGPPMTRPHFNTYRRAFAAFRSCVASASTAGACADSWTRAVGGFLTSAAERRQATQYAAYYVDFLRKGGGASPDCARK